MRLLFGSLLDTGLYHRLPSKWVEFINSKNFLILQAGLMAVAIIYLLWRRPRQGVRLRLTEKLGKLSRMNEPERSLNVHFNHNGHSWDAYEVLGLPAGSSLEKVERAHQEAVSRCDPESREMFDRALAAVRSHIKN